MLHLSQLLFLFTDLTHVSSITGLNKQSAYSYNFTSTTNFTSCSGAIRAGESFGFLVRATLPRLKGELDPELLSVYKGVGQCEEKSNLFLCQVSINGSDCHGPNPSDKNQTGCYCNQFQGDEYIFTIKLTADKIFKYTKLCVLRSEAHVRNFGVAPLPSVLFEKTPVTIKINNHRMNLTHCYFNTTVPEFMLEFCAEYLVNPTLTIEAQSTWQSFAGPCARMNLTAGSSTVWLSFAYSGDCNQKRRIDCQVHTTNYAPSLSERILGWMKLSPPYILAVFAGLIVLTGICCCLKRVHGEKHIMPQTPKLDMNIALTKDNLGIKVLKK